MGKDNTARVPADLKAEVAAVLKRMPPSTGTTWVLEGHAVKVVLTKLRQGGDRDYAARLLAERGWMVAKNDRRKWVEALKMRPA
jgi:hypothetical protein